MRIRLLPAASIELDAAANWYATHAGRAVARSFIAAYEEAATLVAANPEIGAPGLTGVRKLPMRTFPYLVVYRLHQDHVAVIAVAHQRRRPGYWANRR